MAMAISLSENQPQPKPTSQTKLSKATAPIQVADDLPMYRDIPSAPPAPTYEPLPEPEYSNPQVSTVSYIKNLFTFNIVKTLRTKLVFTLGLAPKIS